MAEQLSSAELEQKHRQLLARYIQTLEGAIADFDTAITPPSLTQLTGAMRMLGSQMQLLKSSAADAALDEVDDEPFEAPSLLRVYRPTAKLKSG